MPRSRGFVRWGHRRTSGIGHPIVIGLVVVMLLFVVLLFVPTGTYNVSVTIRMTQSQFIVGSVYTVNSVSGTVTGQSSVIDLSALGFAFATLASQYVLTVTIAGHTVSKSETKFLPSLSLGVVMPVVDTVTVGYIPKGEATIVATLTVNGQQQGAATSTICVGC